MVTRLTAFQFGLIDLFRVVGTMSVLLALFVYWDLLGLFLGGAVAGAIGIGIGIWQKRRWEIVVGSVLTVFTLGTIAFDSGSHAVLDGEFTLELRIAVIDASTGATLPNAAVGADYADYPRGFSRFTGRTDDSGILDYSEEWPWSKHWTALGIVRPYRRYIIQLNRYAFHVSADGYEPTAIRLSDSLGRDSARIGEKLPMVTVRLRKSPGGAGSD